MYSDEGFSETLDRLHANIAGADWHGASSIRMVIYLPLIQNSPEFLIAKTHDEMYSSIDIHVDGLVCDEQELDLLEPACKTWKEYYEIIYKNIKQRNTQEIPKPPV